VNSLPKTVTRQRRGWDLNPGPSAPESGTLYITRLPSHPLTSLAVQLVTVSVHLCIEHDAREAARRAVRSTTEDVCIEIPYAAMELIAIVVNSAHATLRRQTPNQTASRR